MQPRDRLLAAAFAALERDGAAALQARRLAREIDASTMAVYTHFGGMPGLLDALVREGLRRFAAHVRERQTQTDDPVCDLLVGGIAYSEFALANPQLYRLVFGIGSGTSPVADEVWALPEGADAFSVLEGSVARAIAAGRFRRGDARTAATQVLATTHGYLVLQLGGFFDGETSLRATMFPAAIDLMVGLGDDRAAAERSAQAAAARGLSR